MLELIKQPWEWYVAGPLLALVMLSLLFFGKSFGVSVNLRTVCTLAGGGRCSDFFCFDWKAQRWNLWFVLGAMLGGSLARTYLGSDELAEISAHTLRDLEALGIQYTREFIPVEIYNWANLFTTQGFVFIILGGFLLGFGARYAGGCTSGHAITGLSNLQSTSLLAVTGFFIGGLAMTHWLLPVLMTF